MLLNQYKRGFVKLLLTALSIFLISTIFFSCRKSFEGKEDVKFEQRVQSSTDEGGACDLDVTVCEDCSFQEQIEESDSTDQYPTILGNQYVNPYSISVMTQSYNAIHSTNIQELPASDLYVRFKPQTEADLIVLDSLDLELYDYPLDRTVIQDGEFWPDAYVGLGQNEFPWLYTVVESNFQFPAGIIYETLQPLYIPDDDGPVEDYAFNRSKYYATK